jgi:PadR family transcriptional regulator PadR
MRKSAELLQGTLDMLILKAVSLGPLHGYGVLLRIHQFQTVRCRFNRARFTRRSTASSARD